MLKRLNSLHAHNLSWVLWLALLLPLAQSAATWHAYSHDLKASVQRSDSQQPQADHCELCLAAAALSAGALPSVHSLPVSETRHEQPVLRALGVWSSRTALAYRSRAPPFTPR